MAALFAMGVFSAGSVGADPGHLDPEADHTHDELTTLEIGGGTDNTAAAAAASAITRVVGTFNYNLKMEVGWKALAIDVGNLTSDETATITYNGQGEKTDSTDTEDNTYIELKNVPDDFGAKIRISYSDVSTGNTGEPSVYTITLGYTNPVSNDTPGAAVGLTIVASADTDVPAGSDIELTLADFGVPATINEERVLIQTMDADGVSDSFQPSIVEVTGKKIVLSLPAGADGSDNPAKELGPEGAQLAAYQIIIKQSAGITNPTSRGLKTIEVKDKDTANEKPKALIRSKTTADASGGKRGTILTVTAKGIAAGGATAFLVEGDCPDKAKTCGEGTDDDDSNNDISLGNGTASGGTVSIEVDTTSSNFEDGTDPFTKDGDKLAHDLASYPEGAKLGGMNRIFIVDGAGNLTDVGARFAVTPTVEVEDDTVKQGDELEIIYSDWFYGPITKLTIGGEEVDETIGVGTVGGNGDGEFTVTVPNSVRLGEQEIKATGTTMTSEGSLSSISADVAKGTAIIGSLDLTLDPSTVVLGQQFTIKGGGFSTEGQAGADAHILEVSVGSVDLTRTTGGLTVSELKLDTNGNFTDSFELDTAVSNQRLEPGSYRVRVKDFNGRVSTGQLTVPEPNIALDPEESRRGTVVTVVGSNFPAEKLVNIEYDGNLVNAALSDTAGNVRTSFVVPSNAEIGEAQDVVAESSILSSKFKAKAEHSLPKQEIIVTPIQVSSGGRLVVEGHNMPLFTGVTLTIANIGVSGRGFETDGIGSFTREDVLVPQLKAGFHIVEAEVQTQGNTTAKVRTTIEIVDIITRDSEEAFGDLITNGTLTRVWHLDAATQTWSFFDPAPEFADFNTLTEVSSGQIVTIIMATQDEFQGETLYVGSNNVAIE